MIGNIIRLLIHMFAKSAETSRTPIPQIKANEKPLILFKNESDRLKSEYDELFNINNDLYNILTDLALFVSEKMKKSLTVTMILRTQEEQNNIYKGKKQGNREYDKNPWKSPHQFFHAIDLRSRDFNDSEIKQIEDYLNNKYTKSNSYKWTALNHNVGAGDHFHIQYLKRGKNV